MAKVYALSWRSGKNVGIGERMHTKVRMEGGREKRNDDEVEYDRTDRPICEF
jgi:hypothetical protein